MSQIMTRLWILSILTFKKAFNKILHKRLMAEIYGHGIQGDAIQSIWYCLAGHHHSFCINQTCCKSHQWHLMHHDVVCWAHYYFWYAYMNDIDDTELYHRARNPDDITEIQKDINQLVKLSNKWQMDFIVDNCSVMHMRQNNMHGNYIASRSMSNQWITVGKQINLQDPGVVNKNVK